MIEKININGVEYHVTPVAEGELPTGVTVKVDGVIYQLGDPVVATAAEPAATSVEGTIEKISVNGAVYDIADVEAVAAERKRATEAETAIGNYFSEELGREIDARMSADNDTRGKGVLFGGFSNRQTTANEVVIGYKNINQKGEGAFAIPAATTEKAGVMSAEDKLRLVEAACGKVPIRTGKNIFDKSSVVKGFYMGQAGNPIENATYFYSQPMKVEEGISYHFNFNGYGGFALFLDKNMTIVQSFEHTLEAKEVPLGVSYLVVSGIITELEYIMICRSSDDINTYERYTDKKDVLDLIQGIGCNDNLYKEFEKDVFISSTGDPYISVGFYTTPYLPIKGASYIDCVGQFGNEYGGGLSFYDIDKKYLYRINDSSTGKVVVEHKRVQASEISEDAYYVRLTTYGASKLKESGLSTDAFSGKIAELIERNERFEKKTETEIEHLSYSVERLVYMKSRNLFNKASITEGYFLNGGSNPQPNASYFYSDFIKVDGGKDYYTNKNGYGGFYAIYNLDGKRIKTEEMKIGVISVPKDGVTIRLSAPINLVDDLQFELGNVGTPYEDFYEYNTVDLVDNNRKDIEILKDSVVPSCKIMSVSSNQLLGGERMKIPKTPNIKNKHTITFRAKVSQMGSVRISQGTKGYAAGIIEVDSTNIRVYKNTAPSEIAETIVHELSISEYIHIFINVGVKNQLAEISVTTSNGQSYSKEVQWNGCSENVTVECLSGNYTNARLMLGGSAWLEKVWIFGDSYTDYWNGYMSGLNATNYLLDGHSGRVSASAYESLVNELKMGTPAIVVWMMGMNDSDNSSSINSSYKTCFDSAKDLCERYGIDFVPCTIPNVPERIHSFKNAYIKANSERYIDMAEMLGAEVEGSSWYSGLLSTDKVHPTVEGTKLIAKMLCEELPIIM